MPHRDRIRARLAAERASWADHLGPREGRLGPRAGWVLLILGTLGVALSITLLWFAMRDVMEIGGTCASGGPFVVEDQCPGNTAWLTPLSIFAGLGSASAMAVGATRVDASAVGLALFAWPALFLSLGWNFLEYGLDPPFGGTSWSWLMCAVIFAALGLPGLALAVASARGIVGHVRSWLIAAAAGGALVGLAAGIYLDGVIG